jgi:hypothetical protein
MVTPLSIFKWQTSELIRKAQEAGFGDWYPVPERMVDSWPIGAEGDNSKIKRIPQYPLPESTNYLID